MTRWSCTARLLLLVLCRGAFDTRSFLASEVAKESSSSKTRAAAAGECRSFANSFAGSLDNSNSSGYDGAGAGSGSAPARHSTPLLLRLSTAALEASVASTRGRARHAIGGALRETERAALPAAGRGSTSDDFLPPTDPSRLEREACAANDAADLHQLRRLSATLLANDPAASVRAAQTSAREWRPPRPCAACDAPLCQPPTSHAMIALREIEHPTGTAFESERRAMTIALSMRGRYEFADAHPPPRFQVVRQFQ